MANLLLLLLCLLVGVALQRGQVLPAHAHQSLNQLLVNVFIPCLTLLHIPETHFDQRFLLPIAAPWLIFGGSWVFFSLLNKTKPHLFDRKTLGCLIVTSGISSVSFVGFPIFELLYGKPGLEMGILMSQAGSFLVCVTLGVAIASWYGAAEPSVKQMGLSMLRFPPFLAFALALFLNFTGYRHLPLVAELLTKLSAPFSVIALISVGLQLNFSPQNWQRTALAWGLGYKLLVAPLAIFTIFTFLLRQRGTAVDLCVLGAALGPMNTISVVAARFGLNPPLAAQMVGVGIPLSLAVVYLIHLFQ